MIDFLVHLIFALFCNAKYKANCKANQHVQEVIDSVNEYLNEYYEKQRKEVEEYLANTKKNNRT